MGLTAEKSSPKNGAYYQISNKVNNGLDRYSSEIIYVIPMGYHFGVLGPPLVQVVPDVIETVEGRNVTVMCNVTANPKPNRIIWKKPDGILSSARTIVIEGNLTIKKGHYTRQRLQRVYYDKPLGYQIIVSSPSCLFSSQICHQASVKCDSDGA